MGSYDYAFRFLRQPLIPGKIEMYQKSSKKETGNVTRNVNVPLDAMENVTKNVTKNVTRNVHLGDY